MAEDARIAVLTPHPSTDYVGGIETFNRQLQRALGELEVFAYPESPAANPTWRLERVGMEQPYRALRVARSFLRKHREHPFQLVICNGLYGWPLAFGRLDIPAVQVYHFTMAGLARAALPRRGDQVTTGTVSAFFDRLAGRGKEVIAVGHSVLREVERYYGLSGRVISNAVDMTLFTKQDRSHARHALGLSAQAPMGLFIGRAEYAKGFDILLDVAKSMRDITFVVLGTGPTNEPNVRVLEKIPHSKMPLIYSAADFLFLPSRYEGFNLSILEALACDLPLVVSEAAFDLTDDPARMGSVVESQDPLDFVRGIREVLDRSSSYAPRGVVEAAYNFEVFRSKWSSLIRARLEHSSARMGQET